MSGGVLTHISPHAPYGNANGYLDASTEDAQCQIPLFTEQEANSATTIGLKEQPCPVDYKKRQSLLSKQSYMQNAIPQGFPTEIKNAAVWTPELFDLGKVTFILDNEKLAEVEHAMKIFEATNAHLDTISRSTFRLPELGPLLRAMSADIHDGKGAVLIRGIDPQKYSLKQNIILFAGLSSYIGDQRGNQSARNDVLTHMNSISARDVPDPRPGLSNDPLPFHNDHCDVLALYVMETASSGGGAFWASGGQVYNEIAATQPRLISVLAEDNWPHQTCAKARPTAKNLPLLYLDERNEPFFNFTRFSLTGSSAYPRSNEVQPLTEIQAYALDTLHFTAARNAVEVPLQKGDLVFINNRSYFHARGKIEEKTDQRNRHLMRIILRDSEFGHVIPERLNARWSNAFDIEVGKGNWTLEKSHPASFVSNRFFDDAFDDETPMGSHG